MTFRFALDIVHYCIYTYLSIYIRHIFVESFRCFWFEGGESFKVTSRCTILFVGLRILCSTLLHISANCGSFRLSCCSLMNSKFASSVNSRCLLQRLPVDMAGNFWRALNKILVLSAKLHFYTKLARTRTWCIKVEICLCSGRHIMRV